jgi:hypothetical protein
VPRSFLSPVERAALASLPPREAIFVKKCMDVFDAVLVEPGSMLPVVRVAPELAGPRSGPLASRDQGLASPPRLREHRRPVNPTGGAGTDVFDCGVSQWR